MKFLSGAVFLASVVVSAGDLPTVEERIGVITAAVCRAREQYQADDLHPLSYVRSAKAPDFAAAETVEFRVGSFLAKNGDEEKYRKLTVTLDGKGRLKKCYELEVTSCVTREVLNLPESGTRTVNANAKVAEAFRQALSQTPGEAGTAGQGDAPIPVRFPEGKRGERIAAYCRKAKDSRLAELEALLQAAGDNAAVLREVLSGIARSENTVTRELVRPYLESRNAEVRAAAAAAWGKVATRDDLAAIQALLKDENPVVRMMAQMAIAAITSVAQ